MNELPRYLISSVVSLALKRGKMAFVSGPRQVGKTTMSKYLKSNYSQFIYKNWDEVSVKKAWAKDPIKLLESFDFTKLNESRLLVLDEIHKSKGWKGKLKGLFDTEGENLHFLITGSAKLNVYKKGSDSLMGRYLNFRLHPFSVREVHGLGPLTPEIVEQKLFLENPKKLKLDFNKINNLFNFSGFPEPYFNQNIKIKNLWSKGRKEKIIREDLMDLSRVQEVSQIETLCTFLPEKIGSPLSVQALKEDLSVSHDSVTRWLSYLKELYYFFDVSPYSKNIKRSLKKEAKIYFYDWTECESEGQKFENFIASHLIKACHFWEDTGEGDFQLKYLRDKEKNEIDFLILKNQKPWFTVECKLSQRNLDVNYKKFQKQLNCPHIQVIYDQKTFQKIDEKTWIMGSDYFLGNLV